MRRNLFAALLLALLLVVGVIWWLTSKKPSEPTSSPSPVTTAQIASNGAPGNPSNILEVVRQRDAERLKLDSSRWWKTPVSFYGRIVDQNGEPVSQADVRFELNDTSARGTTDYSAKSDANGFFSLTGVKGKNLAVYITKTGYYQGRAENNNFDYYDIASGNQYKPDPRHPEVFHIYKGGKKVALIMKELILRPKLDEPVNVDLLNGTTNSMGGQLRFELLENERRGRDGTRAKCLVRLSMVDGGIQTNAEEFPFTAPEAGYESFVQIGSETGSSPSGWGTTTARAVFLKVGGLYARAQVELNPGGSRFVLDYFVNPSGSRNLEPDPSLPFPDLESYNAYKAAHSQAAK